MFNSDKINIFFIIKLKLNCISKKPSCYRTMYCKFQFSIKISYISIDQINIGWAHIS